MNFALVQSMLRRPRVLRAGKAPLYWKRDYSRLTEGLGSLPRTCDWVKEIAETQPRLLSEPLLGTCLTAVTSNGVAARSDSNDESPDNRLTSPHLSGNRSKGTAFEPTASSKRRQVQSPSFRNEKSENAGRFAVAAQLPRRAPDSLLRRAAPDALRVTENLIRANASLPHGRAGSPAVNSFPQVTRKEWLQLVAERAASKWTSDWIFPSTRKYSPPTVSGNQTERSGTSATDTPAHDSAAPASTPPATAETLSLPPLQHDWLLPIGGQQASPQLLASLVKPSRTLLGTPERVHRGKETFSGIDSEPGSLPSAPDPLASRQRSFTDGPEFSRPLERLFDRQSPALPEDSDRSRLFEPTINSEEREQHASPNLAPTALTPALSPLLPPAFAGASPLPVAADAARRIAWRDEVEAQETDLSVLAAQVKRILDEEARRHGIDV